MSATPAQREAAEMALGDLEKTRQGGLYTVLGSWDASGSSIGEVIFGGSSKKAAVYYFETTMVEALASQRRQLERIGGDADWNAWVASAERLNRDMNEVLGYRSEWSLTKVLYSAGKQTAADIANAGKRVADAAQSGTTWGVLAALAVLYVVWRVK